MTRNIMVCIRQGTVGILALAIALAGFAPTVATADLVGTQELLAEERAEEQRSQLIDALEREEIQEQLTALGVEPDTARERVAGMTDQEVQELSGDLEVLPAGAGVGVVTVLLIVLLILLLR